MKQYLEQRIAKLEKEKQELFDNKLVYSDAYTVCSIQIQFAKEMLEELQRSVPFTEEEIDAIVDKKYSIRNPGEFGWKTIMQRRIGYKEGLIDMQNKLKLQAGWSNNGMINYAQYKLDIKKMNDSGTTIGYMTPKEWLRWKQFKTQEK